MSDMEYKEMAKVMTDEEVKTCMAILIEDSVILDIERNTIQNYIRVKYRLIGDHNKGIYWISLLSNSIEDVEEKHLRHEARYLYMQYLVAMGYSDYWKGNMFVEE